MHRSVHRSGTGISVVEVLETTAHGFACPNGLCEAPMVKAESEVKVEMVMG